MGKLILTSLGLLTLLIPQASFSDIVFDGTTGTAGPATVNASGEIEIAERDGRVTGSTLFHSFSEFSFEDTEAARFTGSSNINLVINRVTGGSPSRIDGFLSSDMNADFYFFNPNGVIFGIESSIGINGAFKVIDRSFPDFEKVSATNLIDQSNDPVLTITDPEKLLFILNQSESKRKNELLPQKCGSAGLRDRSSFVVRPSQDATAAPGSYELASAEASAMDIQLALNANCLN